VHLFFSQKILCVSVTGLFWSPKTENSPLLTHKPKKQILFKIYIYIYKSLQVWSPSLCFSFSKILLARQNGATHLDFAKNAVLAITFGFHQTSNQSFSFQFCEVKWIGWKSSKRGL
jgi:hypothetical protein